MKITSIAIFFILILAACYNTEPQVAPGTQYLESLIDIMEQNSINRNKIDWGKFRKDAEALADGKQSIEDIYTILPSVLTMLGDHQSYIIHDEQYIFGDPLTCFAAKTEPMEQLDHVGHIRPGDYANGNQQTFAIAIQNRLRDQDDVSLAGWIIDLRGNSNEDLLAIITGLGPLIGQGTVGFYVEPDGDSAPIAYSDGKGTEGTEAQVDVLYPYEMKSVGQKVALLLDQASANTNEMLAMTFRGRGAVKTFGTSTCGLSTVTYPFKLSDKSILHLTAASFGDWQKRINPGPITPDVLVEGDKEVVAKAVEWLKSN
jgi:carboxyl-terminal processing protease